MASHSHLPGLSPRVCADRGAADQDKALALHLGRDEILGKRLSGPVAFLVESHSVQLAATEQEELVLELQQLVVLGQPSVLGVH
jgi:hypothetical protein